MKIIVTKRIITTLIPDSQINAVYEVSDDVGSHLIEIGVAEKVNKKASEKAKQPKAKAQPKPKTTAKTKK